MSEARVIECSVKAIFEDPAIGALLAEYERESAIPQLGKPAPNLASYEALESTGMAQCFGAYADGELRGFAMVIACIVPHYGLSSGTVESLFVAREARGMRLGRMLMDAMEGHCRKLGCTALFYSAPVGSRLARLLFLDSDRYTNTNLVFCRRLQ